jgi:hypothetical protein
MPDGIVRRYATCRPCGPAGRISDSQRHPRPGLAGVRSDAPLENRPRRFGVGSTARRFALPNCPVGVLSVRSIPTHVPGKQVIDAEFPGDLFASFVMVRYSRRALVERTRTPATLVRRLVSSSLTPWPKNASSAAPTFSNGRTASDRTGAAAASRRSALGTVESNSLGGIERYELAGDLAGSDFDEGRRRNTCKPYSCGELQRPLTGGHAHRVSTHNARRRPRLRA